MINDKLIIYRGVYCDPNREKCITSTRTFYFLATLVLLQNILIPYERYKILFNHFWPKRPRLNGEC